MKNNAALLHLLLCKKKHNSIMEMKGATSNCDWYLEEQVENSWASNNHIEWLEKAEKIAELSQLEAEELNILLNKITKIIGEIESLGFGNGNLQEIIKSILLKSLS